MPGRTDIAKDADAAHIERLRDLVDEYLSDLVETKTPNSLYEPVAQVLTSRGKRLRPLLTLLTAEAFGTPPDRSLPAAAAVEVFHNFTLVHDDIMDRSPERRGRPTVHVVWGAPAAILSGDFLLGMSYQLLSRLDNAAVRPALACFSEMVVRLCEGQALDGEFESSDTITVPDYLDMVSRKTGALLIASLKLGGIVGSASEKHLDALTRVGYHLGLAFQIQDDLLDVTAESEKWGKPIGGDLLSGKRTFLLLAAVESEAGRGENWFKSVMSERGIDPTRIAEAKERLERLGVLERSKSVILTEYGKALDALESLEGDVSLRMVRSIVEQMRTRVQ